MSWAILVIAAALFMHAACSVPAKGMRVTYWLLLFLPGLVALAIAAVLHILPQLLR